MKNRLLIALFSVGTIFGFGGGLFSMAFHHGHHAQRRQAAFEDHIADVCVDAARRAEPRRAYVDDHRDWGRSAYVDDRGDWDRSDRYDRRRHRRHRHDR
jgi:hypothetical protein